MVTFLLKSVPARCTEMHKAGRWREGASWTVLAALPWVGAGGCRPSQPLREGKSGTHQHRHNLLFPPPSSPLALPSFLSSL